MAETFCGKNCADCGKMQNGTCSGCRVGPGRSIGGECEIARCCRSRGHESCDTCVTRNTCWTYGDRFSQPEKRLCKLEWEQQQKQVKMRRSVLLGKWTWYLFLLNIPSLIAVIMTDENVVQWLPMLKTPGHLLELVISLVYGLILLKMSPAEPRFRTAAWCTLGILAVEGVFELLLKAESLPLLLSLPLVAVSLVGRYHEFKGFANALYGVNNDLAQKWETIWKWYIGSYAVTLGSVILAFMGSIWAVLALLAVSIALVVIGILQIIYTYRTAKAFKYYILRS